MSKKIIKMLFMGMCSIMIWSAMPNQLVEAGTISDEYIDALTWEEDANGNIYFYSFADLKELTERSYSSYQMAYYRGSDLIIEEDLVLPEKLFVDFMGDTVKIPEGVTVTTGYASLYFTDLVVEGTLVNNQMVQVYGNLTITGEILNNGGLNIFYPDSLDCIAGRENIVYGDEQGSLYFHYDLNDMSSLKKCVEAAESDKDIHAHYIGWYNGTGELEINESIKVPQNVSMRVSGYSISIADGCRVDYCGELSVNDVINVAGTLNNLGDINVANGTINIKESGKYQGHGKLLIYDIEREDINAVVPGLDLTKYTIIETNDEYGRLYCELKYNTGFEDVEANAFYENPVQWAVENNITNGHGSAETFCPELNCTRGQVATFMWRAEGKPAVSNLQNVFTDVKSGEYYYDAVLWAVENGVTNGYGSTTTFCPDVICNRGQIVTFLYRGMN